MPKSIRSSMRLMIVYRTITAAICITTTIMTRIAITTITAIPVPTVTGKPPPRSRRRKAGTVAAVPNTPATRGRDRIDVTEAAALFRLLTWLSPSFPIGAFSYSSGIEWAVESGDISDAASLCNWLGTMLTDGSGFCDGVFLSQTHRATTLRDGAMLREIAELAAAFATSRERQLETSSQGRAFIDIARAAWNCDGLAQMIGCCDGAIVYPVAVGLVSAAHAIPLAPTMHGFLHAVVSNWISAAARLIPLGQTDSQRVLALLEQAVAATAGRALEASLDDLGSATFRADLASLRHETQYTRLFRS
jgi:urease accessory protein